MAAFANWAYPAYDERWRQVANFREDDTDPKEEWVNQDAGLDGRGGSSYINGVVLRDRDENTAWTSASDGTLEERIYLCQNWRGDVSALVYANGDQVEQVRYSPYGTPFGLPGGDCDSDGDCDYGDTVDSDQIQAWINATAYDVRGDLDLDGDVDAGDKATVQSNNQGTMLSRGALSVRGNRLGYGGGYANMPVGLWYARDRHLSAETGRWLRRDALGYDAGPNLYAYVNCRPVMSVDPYGLDGLVISAVGQEAGSTVTVRENIYTCDCCDDPTVKAKAAAAAGGGLPAGRTVCCEGKKVTCNWLEELAEGAGYGDNPNEAAALGLAKKCVDAHEKKHADSHTGSCAGKGFGDAIGDAAPPEPPDMTSKQAETEAYHAQLDCLTNGGDLGSHDCATTADPMGCFKEVDKFVTAACESLAAKGDGTPHPACNP